jgi:hypothetical protein
MRLETNARRAPGMCHLEIAFIPAEGPAAVSPGGTIETTTPTGTLPILWFVIADDRLSANIVPESSLPHQSMGIGFQCRHVVRLDLPPLPAGSYLVRLEPLSTWFDLDDEVAY